MTYWPKHQPQLNRGTGTDSVDCGIRATQVSIDDATLGDKVPSVKRIRTAMNDWDETNYFGWEKSIDSLGATHGVHGVLTNSLEELAAHLKAGLGAVVATNYGKLRRQAPAKTGSETFNGGHALFLKKLVRRNGVWNTRDYDSLNDGRYRGCPKGAVWMPWKKMKVGLLGLSSVGNIFATLVFPDGATSGLEPGADLPQEPEVNLFSVLADLREFQDDTGQDIAGIIRDYESLLGLSELADADLATIEQAFKL